MIKENSYYIKSKKLEEPAFDRSFDTKEQAQSFLDGMIVTEYYQVAFNNKNPLVNKIIVEGLTDTDLRDLLKPFISFDEYVSKNDSDNIVLGLYILNEPLAVEPLENFCSRTPGVVDVDSSDSDTISNASVVYVEFKRDQDSKEDIFGLIKDLSILSDTEIDDFVISFPHTDQKYPFSVDLLELYFKEMV